MSTLDPGSLVLDLRASLRESLPPELLRALTLYIAASELLCGDDVRPGDVGALRGVTAHFALRALGVDDLRIERAKEHLSTGHHPDTLNRRQ